MLKNGERVEGKSVTRCSSNAEVTLHHSSERKSHLEMGHTSDGGVITALCGSHVIAATTVTTSSTTTSIES